METSPGEKRVVFRMLPNNSRQAESICAKIVDISKQGKKNVVLIHEDNAYGNFLYRRVSATLKDKVSIFTFLVDDRNNTHVLMPSLERIKDRVDSIVYLGYAQRATDLLQDLSGYGLDLPVILSDGCFSIEPALRSVASRLKTVYLSFPVEPWTERPQQELSGFERYGYNGYLLLARLADSSQRTGTHSLKEALNGVNVPDKVIAKHPDWYTSYTFNDDGEPQQPGFTMINVATHKK